MKAMPFALALGAVASLAFTPASFAAISCPNRVPAAITAPTTEGGRACQNAIAKAAASYVKTQVKTTAGCMGKQGPGACPSTKDNDKAQKAALKARDAVVKACSGGELADLETSYSAFTDPATVASCTVSQNNVESRLIAFQANGTPGEVNTNKERQKCSSTLNKSGVKYALAALQAANKCLAAKIKEGAVGNLAPVCIGQWSGGLFTAPSDPKAADALDKALDKLESSVAKACTPVSAFFMHSIFACPGATDVEDLQNCLACSIWDSSLSILEAQYSETGTLVSPGPDALQTAIDNAGLNAKLLVASGTYQEDVSITNNVLHAGTKIVGCGGGSGDRPKLQPPTMGGPYLNGVFAAGVDGLGFQSLEVSGGWEENGIFVTGAAGVTFRDLVTDGGDGTSACVLGPNDGAACTTNGDCPSGICVDSVSTYGIFPVESSDVLVELSSAVRIRDAGIYVGSCEGVIMRYNTATGNVAGMELENSSDGIVHNNYMAGNVGGLLVFKLPGPTVQRGHDHEVVFNVVDSNDVTPNFGIPGTTVAGIPPGTGLVVLSTRDARYRHNLITNNDTYGIAAIDQQAFDALAGGALGGNYSHTCAAPDAPFEKCNPGNAAVDCPLSTTCNLDQKLENNAFIDNRVTGNGTSPAGGSVNPGNAVYAVIEEDPGGNNNCFNNLNPGTPLGNTTTQSCGM